MLHYIGDLAHISQSKFNFPAGLGCEAFSLPIEMQPSGLVLYDKVGTTKTTVFHFLENPSKYLAWVLSSIDVVHDASAVLSAH